jgi:hypothetical protein
MLRLFGIGTPNLRSRRPLKRSNVCLREDNMYPAKSHVSTSQADVSMLHTAFPHLRRPALPSSDEVLSNFW